MGQQVSPGTCVSRGKLSGPGANESLTMQLKRAEALMALPERLETECDFQFQRAGLDAHGELRRVELRRLLWTFAHGLGSTELTWQAIEDAAVAGTIEPHVPVVNRAEFFRCVLKTVHLVAAELRGRIEEEKEASLRQKELLGSADSSSPWSALAHQHTHAARAASSSCSSRSASPASVSSRQSEASFEDGEVVPQSTGKEEHAYTVGSPGEEQSAAATSTFAQPPPETPLFLPAPGGSSDDAALINGMTAMVLSNEGTFDPQSLFIGSGILELSDVTQPASETRHILREGHSTFDLTLLDSACCGSEITQLPIAQLIPAYAMRSNSLDRMLVLGFAGDEALCLWFTTVQDCELCVSALMSCRADVRE
mmetsp:Transcript_98373/g.195027  ORF Transcript_98373/g.195027 Transcript_98373/m.195027 type:complete len:368 (+) Transcript_98373:141-1244(+)